MQYYPNGYTVSLIDLQLRRDVPSKMVTQNDLSGLRNDKINVQLRAYLQLISVGSGKTAVINIVKEVLTYAKNMTTHMSSHAEKVRHF